MNDWLKGKAFGMPRWAWILLFTGAVGVGLYLRSQNMEEMEPEGEEEELPSEDELDYFDGTDTAGGLAAAGLVGPAGQSLVPVQAPYIPEGFIDIFASQGETISELGGAIATKEPGERVEVIREIEPPIAVTGGGSPRRKPAHKPKKKKQKKPKQKKQKKQKKPKGKSKGKAKRRGKKPKNRRRR